MSLVTMVIVGKADNECVRLGNAAMLGVAGSAPFVRDADVVAVVFIIQGGGGWESE